MKTLNRILLNRCSRPATVAALCIALVFSLPLGHNVLLATVWQNGLSSDIVLQLARQRQFSGAGSVNNRFGTGVAIAPGWVLTVAHVAGISTRSSFELNGQIYTGTPVIHPTADVALIRLDADAQLPPSTAFIRPNFDFDPVDNLVWKSGSGRFGSRRDSNTGGLALGDGLQRAGTNVVNGRRSQLQVDVGPTDALTFLRPATPFTVTTAPGDSGGPMFMQVNNQWVVSGVTIGVVVGVGFVDTDVSAYYDWIEDVTGLDFADSSPGPSELFFDTDFTTPGPQSAILDGFTPVWDNFHPFFTGGTEGFNYTWENDFAPIAVFGTSQTGANAVLVQSDINYQGIRFDPILEVINVDGFHLMDDGGSLRATAGGAVIEVNQNAIISASLAGATGEGIVKTGDAELVLDGNNTAFEAKLVIESGVVSVESQTALGGGIVSDESKTTVQSGGTLHLTGGGISLNERIEISGPGANNQGSIRVSRGQHAITQELTVVSDATIAVAENSTLTLSGQIEEHLDMAGEGATLTQTGDGTIVYSGQSNLNELHVDQGIAAGAGEFLGLVNVSASGELRPADTSAGRAIGSFQAGQLLVAEGSNIRFDISPILNTGDVVVVEENVILAGDLIVDFLGTPSVGDEFMLVNNLGNQNVVGEFANLNVSSSSPIPDGVRFLVNYAGGTGNDVVLVTAPASQVGDFDLDGDVDADDIDFYSGNLGQSAVADLAKLDLDGDGMVTLADHDQHITQLAQTSNGEVGALIGDINLDGDVDVLGDAFILVANLRSSGPNRYSSGDLNADQVVDVLGDAFRLVLNLGLSNEP